MTAWKPLTLLAIFLFFGQHLAKADPCGCDSVLWSGIFNEYSYESEVNLQQDIKRVVLLDEKERRERKDEQDIGLDVGFKKILSLGFESESNRKDIEEMRTLLKVNEELAWKSSAYENLRLKMVSEAVVEAWKDCKKNNCVGLVGNFSGDLGTVNGIILFSVDYVPRAQSDQTVIIADDAIVTGAKIVSASSLGKGVMISPFSGRTMVLQRSGWSAVTVRVNLEGARSVEANLPELRKPTPPKADIVVEEVTYALRAVGVWPKVRGDWDMDTDGGDRVPVECSTKLVQDNDSIKLEVFFSCEEDGGDHTTIRGTRTFNVYTAPRGMKLVAIKANGGMTQRFTGSTRGRARGFYPFRGLANTYWDQLEFRVDGRGSDRQIIGVAGKLRIAVTLEKTK